MEPIYAALAAWIAAMTGRTAILAGQNAPAPAAPYCAFRVIASDLEAHDFDYPAGDDNVGVIRWLTGTLSVQVIGEAGKPGAVDEIGHALAERCFDNVLAIDTLGRSVAFRRVLSGPSDISILDGAGLLPRVNLDIEIAFTREFTHAAGRIETVDYSAAVGGKEITGVLP